VVLVKPFTLMSNEIGKTLFKENCASCHEFGRILTGPDLTNITQKRTNDWLFNFIKNSEKMIAEGDEEAIKIYNDFKQVKMPPSSLSDSEIVVLINYLRNYKPDTTTKVLSSQTTVDTETNSKIPLKLIISGILLIIVALTFTLTFHFQIKNFIFSSFNSLIHPFIFLLVILFLIINFTVAAIRFFDLKRQNSLITNQPYSMEFSHQQHASEFQINCIYCHLNAQSLPKANIPNPKHCMKCHHYIKKGKDNDTTEIAKLKEIVLKEKPIQWKKGYRLNSHVHFDHGLHVQSAGFNCNSCHSDSNNVTILYLQFSMNWCINCHKKNQYKLKNNYFVGMQTNKPEINNDCVCCHY